MKSSLPRWAPERNREGVGLLAALLTVIATISSVLVAAMLISLSSSVHPLGRFLFFTISLEALLGVVAYCLYRLARQRWPSNPGGALAVSAFLVCVFQVPALFLLILSVPM
jgi:peptidoglycan/LPS O-acetylase OafA/YrhL